MDCSPPGSSVQEIFQARILEWVAISFSWVINETRFYRHYSSQFLMIANYFATGIWILSRYTIPGLGDEGLAKSCLEIPFTQKCGHKTAYHWHKVWAVRWATEIWPLFYAWMFTWVKHSMIYVIVIGFVWSSNWVTVIYDSACSTFLGFIIIFVHNHIEEDFSTGPLQC